MDRTSFALESFKNMQDLIKFSDQKAAAILVVSGVIFTAFFKFSSSLTISSTFNFLSVLTFISLFLTASSLIIVVYVVTMRILKPRLAESYNDDELSLYYFEHIAYMGKAHLKIEYENLDDEKIREFLIDQQYEVSKILKRKIENLNLSFRLLFFSVVAFTASVTLVEIA